MELYHLKINRASLSANHRSTIVQKIKLKFSPLRRRLTLPNLIVLSGFIVAIMYIFSYLFPFTDNSFVVNNVRPVAAQVTGFITHIYVKNGEYVKKGQKLFTVFKKPYQYTVDQLNADFETGEAKLLGLKTMYERDQSISENRQRVYIKLAQDNQKYRRGYKARSISLITLQNSLQDMHAANDDWKAAKKQLDIDKHAITAQEKELKSIRAKINIAKVNLKLTDVRAHGNGVVQNFFFSIGAPININQPLFSLVDTDEIYIQANFNETDLRNVKKGSKVLIFPRMYLGRKMFHGIVDSDYWGANRQDVDHRTQLQTVINENQWILLPQRLPVIIKITDPDPHFPMRVGTSAYVYVKT